jgi:hypothetical protein
MGAGDPGGRGVETKATLRFPGYQWYRITHLVSEPQDPRPGFPPIPTLVNPEPQSQRSASSDPLERSAG